MQIVSVSRRTDIPAFYLPWFLERLRQGFALSVNPYNPTQIRRVPLSAQETACLVLWTKNPAPLFTHLDALERCGIPFYVQVTLTGLGAVLEPGVPETSLVLSVMRRLGRRLGPHRVVWRFDPICPEVGDDGRGVVERFDRLSSALQGAVERVVISFLDLSGQAGRRIEKCQPGRFVDPERLPKRQSRALLGHCLPPMGELAARRGMELVACAPRTELSPYGVEARPCIDPQLVERISGKKLPSARDRHQREACRCIPSVDLGMYGTCPHGCLYCYASCQSALAKGRRHDPKSPRLLEPVSGGELKQRSLWESNDPEN